MMSDCWDCKWFKNKKEHLFSTFFVDGGYKRWKWSDKPFLPPYKMCNHPYCFQEKRVTNTGEKEKKIKERVVGQFQLNRNKDCKYFELKWWRKFRL